MTTTKPSTALKLLKNKGQPIVRVSVPAATVTDLRIGSLRNDHHAWAELLKLAQIPMVQTLARGWGLAGEECPRCGAVELLSGEPALTLAPGNYRADESRSRPTRTRCGNCGAGEYADEFFVRRLGRSAKRLDQMRGVGGRPEEQTFIAVMHKGAWKLDRSFVGAAKQHEPAWPLDLEGWCAIAINAFTEEIAFAALRHSDFDPSWAALAPVDKELRPTTRWVEGIRWVVADESAFDEVQRERRRQHNADLEKKIAQIRAEQRAT